MTTEQLNEIEELKRDCEKELTAEELKLLRKMGRLCLILKYMNTKIAIFIAISIIPIIIAVLTFMSTGNLYIFLIALLVSAALFQLSIKIMFTDHEEEHELYTICYEIIQERLKQETSCLTQIK